MSRKGVFLSLAIILMVAMTPMSVEAYNNSTTWTWQCGIRVNVHIESIDLWSTAFPYDIIARLTLLDLGLVSQVLSITFAIKLITKTEDTGIYTAASPYAQPGDSISLLGRFNLTAEQIYEGELAEYYYQLNQSVRLQNGTVQNLWMHLKGPHPASFASHPIFILWPWLPIGMVFVIYWGVFFGLRKFNRRYDEVAMQESEQDAPSESS